MTCSTLPVTIDLCETTELFLPYICYYLVTFVSHSAGTAILQPPWHSDLKLTLKYLRHDK